jgi:hypothetical protein
MIFVVWHFGVVLKSIHFFNNLLDISSYCFVLVYLLIKHSTSASVSISRMMTIITCPPGLLNMLPQFSTQTLFPLPTALALPPHRLQEHVSHNASDTLTHLNMRRR